VTTPNELISLLVEARKVIATNSGALAGAALTMGIMDTVRPGLYENAKMVARITAAIEEFYADEI
jgi:hypothetical protein